MMKLAVLFMSLFLVCSATAQRRTGKRITSYSLGITGSLPQEPFMGGVGCYLDYGKSYPLFFGKRQRGGATPSVYFDLGAQYQLITTKTGLGSPPRGMQVFRQHAGVAQIGLQYIFSSTSGNAGPWGRKSSFGFFTLQGGAMVGYSYIGNNYIQDGGFPLNSPSTPLLLGYYAGFRSLNAVHGISLNVRWNHDLIPTFNLITAKTGWISVGVGWNRLESECQKSSRKMKRILPTLGNG